MGLSFVTLIAAPANTQEPAWLPLGLSTKQSGPSPQKYPRLHPGSNQIDFFVQGASMDGILSKSLSTACARGNFNQKKNKRYYVLVDMPNGYKKKFGYADFSGVNLSDPGNRKGPSQIYLFENDRTSECKVFVAVTER